MFDDYLKSELLDKYNLPKQFPTKSEFIPLPKGSVTKVNIKGKYVRKQPEEKEEIIKQIRYIRKKDKVKNKTTYYVCSDGLCKVPTNSFLEAKKSFFKSTFLLGNYCISL